MTMAIGRRRQVDVLLADRTDSGVEDRDPNFVVRLLQQSLLQSLDRSSHVGP